eukprot:1484474-Prymnesium_polylepis.1
MASQSLRVQKTAVHAADASRRQTRGGMGGCTGADPGPDTSPKQGGSGQKREGCVRLRVCAGGVQQRAAAG